ncbi:MAG TPA: ATP-binding cassette domain-containing protein [Terriglobales bacterium]|nr:ATP-binding cassette domain-containing protein [Terriglobales bacterium]
MTFAIETKGVVKIYEGGVRALDYVDLTVKAGDAFTLLGPNGAGKTTLMRILTTQLKPTSGEAHIFGLDVVRRGAEVRKVMNYVPQEMSVWTDVSGYENLLIYSKIYGIPSKVRKKTIDEALEVMGLSATAKSLVRTYSGGMIRRLEIASALLIKPKVLFLDEPTIGLDPSARKAVWEKILSFKKEYGITVFFNTHYMDEADLYSDEIAIIDRGKIVKTGTADELKHSIRVEYIHFGLKREGIGEEILDKVRALDTVSDLEVQERELTVTVENAETALVGILDVLRGEGVGIEKISTAKPSMDDVFLKYAGTVLSRGTGIKEVRQVRRIIKKG